MKTIKNALAIAAVCTMVISASAQDVTQVATKVQNKIDQAQATLNKGKTAVAQAKAVSDVAGSTVGQTVVKAAVAVGKEQVKAKGKAVVAKGKEKVNQAVTKTAVGMISGKSAQEAAKSAGQEVLEETKSEVKNEVSKAQEQLNSVKGLLK